MRRRRFQLWPEWPSPAITAAAVLAIVTGASAQPQPFRFVPDHAGDHSRRAFLDLGPGTAPAGSNLVLPDLLSFRIGAWHPLNAADDLFRGGWAENAHFFRLDLIFDGLVNPPGTIGCCGGSVNPFLHGPRPLFGYVEIDMDAHTGTGGDLDFPNLLYLGNVGRFGGLPPSSRLAGRAAVDGRDFDGDIASPPFVDRSGEEFRIAFHGWEIMEIERSGTNTHFGPGDTWVLIGTLFHRAAGYERFSSACCTGPDGSYNPVVRIQFSHITEVNRTVVSLVYPLTNAGAADADGFVPIQPLDNIVDNQNSVHEALNELVVSAQVANDSDRQDPEFAIIADWQFQNAADYLDPRNWEITVLVGGIYRHPESGHLFLAWSDIWPNVLPGDFNGDGAINADDVAALHQYIADNDGNAAIDQDQMVNEIISLVNFIPNFSVFDLNYDGQVRATDRPADPIRYDVDGDGDVDLRDFGYFQRCFSSQPASALAPECSRFDANADDVLGPQEVAGFLAAMTGPQ